MLEIIEKTQSSGLLHSKKRPMNRIPLLIICITASIIVGIIVSMVVWFNVQLSPANSKSVQLVKVTIASGSTPVQIGKELEKQSIIRSSSAFNVYLRIFGKSNILQAGTYRLSPAEAVPEIVEHLSKGTVDQFSITFYPGATLVDNHTKPGQKKYDVTTILQNAGFTDQEIQSALNKIYVSPLFADKPASADLEGYIYGETYNFNTGATVEDIFKGVFAEFYDKIVKNKLIASFASRGLNLYEGITLASIVQREANTADGQKQVAQVFYSRLAIDMALGSDVTYQYIADKTGVARDPYMISPYNTRNVVGLPPGPIAAPGLSALLAVAQPANTDYLYFLSDSDGKLYFAYTLAEHEANIVDHCKEACTTP